MMAHLEHLRPRTAGRGAGGTSEARPSGSRPWKRTMNATAGSTGFGSGMPGASGLAASPTALRLPMSEEAGKNGVGGHAIAGGGGGSGWGARRQVAKLRIIFRGERYRVAGGALAPIEVTSDMQAEDKARPDGLKCPKPTGRRQPCRSCHPPQRRASRTRRPVRDDGETARCPATHRRSDAQESGQGRARLAEH